MRSRGRTRRGIRAPVIREARTARRLSGGSHRMEHAARILVGGDVVDRGAGDAAQRLAGEEGLMAGDEHVREGQEPGEDIVLNGLLRQVLEEEVGLLLVDIEREPADHPALEPADHGAGIHHRTAAGVHDHHAALHEADGPIIDQVMRVGRERTLQTENVGLGEKPLERHIGHAEGRAFVGRIGIRGDHAAAEAAHDAREGAPDEAGADDAHGLAAEIEAEEPLKGEIAFAHPVEGAVGVAVEREDQGHRMFGDRMGRIGGHAPHRHPGGLGCRQIDMVEARRAQRDQLRAGRGQLGDDGRRHLIVHEGADAVGPAGEAHRLVGQARLDEGQLVPALVGGGEKLAVIGLGAEDGDVQGRLLPIISRKANAMARGSVNPGWSSRGDGCASCPMLRRATGSGIAPAPACGGSGRFPSQPPGKGAGNMDAETEAALVAAGRRYFADRRAKVPGFVRRTFGLRGTLGLHRHALGWDILKAPINVALSPLFVASRLGALAADGLSARGIARWLRARRILLPTAVARETERRIVADLLELPWRQGGNGSSRDALAEAMLAEPALRALIQRRLEAGVEARVAARLGDYSGTRSAVAEMTTAMGTLGAGALAFNALTPGVLSLAPALSAILAHQAALAAFPSAGRSARSGSGSFRWRPRRCRPARWWCP